MYRGLDSYAGALHTDKMPETKGNRLTHTDDIDYQYDEFGCLIEARKRNRQLSAYEIDTSRPHRRYHYDSERRLIRVELGKGGEASYQYDAFGRRIKKTVKGKYGDEKHTEFIWEGDTLIAERSDARGYRSYIYEPNSFRPLALFEGEGAESKVYYYHLDPNGTPIDVTDERGNGVCVTDHVKLIH